MYLPFPLLPPPSPNLPNRAPYPALQLSFSQALPTCFANSDGECPSGQDCHVESWILFELKSTVRWEREGGGDEGGTVRWGQ